MENNLIKQLEELKLYALEQMNISDELSVSRGIEKSDKVYTKGKAFAYCDIYSKINNLLMEGQIK